MNVLTDSEIRDILWAKLTAIPGTVQIIFSNSRCRNCGEKVRVLLVLALDGMMSTIRVMSSICYPCQGDVRLMSEFCHMEQELVHPSLPEPSHPSKSVRWGRERRQGHEKAGGGKRAREGEEA